MRTHISPIGYNSTSVTRPVLSRGIDTGDGVVLLRPNVPDDSRAKEAINDVKRMLREIEPEVTLSTESIPHENFHAAIQACDDIIQDAEGDCILNLGGGARDVLLPLTIASLANATTVDTVLFFSDIDGTVRELNLPRLTADIPDTTQPTLAEIAETNGGISIPELTATTGQSKSTVTRHVNHLADEQIVNTWKEGKTKYVRITLTGKILIH